MPVRALLKAQIAAHRRLCAYFTLDRDHDGGVLARGGDGGGGRIDLGPLVLDRDAQALYVRGREVNLTPRQLAVLAYFLDNPGELLTRDRILDEVWGIDFETGTNMIDVYVHHLRRVLGDHGLDPSIRTIRGKGYRFEPTGLEAPDAVE